MVTLSLSQAKRLASILPKGVDQPSEYLAANLWLFRGRHRYRLLEEPVPHIRGITYDGAVHALPLVPLNRGNAHALLSSGADCLFPFGGDGPRLAAQLGLRAQYLEADSDYWFEAATLAGLKGAKERRSQARRYVKEWKPRFEVWRAELACDALEILNGWEADVNRPRDKTDLQECWEAIKMADALGLGGVLVRTYAGQPVAFLLASCAGNSRIIHFAKGRRAHSAAYPVMFSHYAGLCGAEWINFEQDLGNDGLAQSKRAYAPHHRQPKWRLVHP